MIYLVDLENTKVDGLAGIQALTENDTVVVFCSPVCAKKMDTELLCCSRAALRFVRCMPNGHKNYMDFQIVAAASYFLSSGNEVCIVSDDKGFQAVRDFWQGNTLFPQTCHVQLQSRLKEGEELPVKAAEKKKKNESVKKEPEVKSPPDTETALKEHLKKILEESKTQKDLKSKLYSAFGKETGKQLFALYKHKYKEK